MKFKKLMALGMAAVMTMSLAACGSSDNTTGNASNEDAASTDANAPADSSTSSNDTTDKTGVPTIDEITVGEDYKDLTASIKVLTNRTDIVDTVYAGYAQQFMDLYPNITVEYEGITDYEESVSLRLSAGDGAISCLFQQAYQRMNYQLILCQLVIQHIKQYL